MNTKEKYYVRFSIVNKSTAKSIGTIEFLQGMNLKKHGNIGILRLDLGSEFEISNVITELLQMIEDYFFYDYFGANSIVTKAIPFGEQRRLSLKQLGYQIFLMILKSYLTTITLLKMMGFN
ncbi:hypothetical protein ACFTAO_50675 [Paenibacillus rhizoplanae]